MKLGFAKRGGGSGSPTGAAGGGLSGTYPNPSLVAASPTTSIQYNNAGAFGGSSSLTWDDSTKLLTIGTSAATGHIAQSEVGLDPILPGWWGSSKVLFTSVAEYGLVVESGGRHGIGVVQFQSGGVSSEAIGGQAVTDVTDADVQTMTGAASVIGGAGINARFLYDFFAFLPYSLDGLATFTHAVGYGAADFTEGVNRYTFRSDQSAGPNNWQFYGAGTAKSHFGGPVDVVGSVGIAAVAVASLPASPVEGMRASVNNSNAVSFTAGIGLVVAGGGTTHVPVYYAGTNWRIG